MKGEDLTLLKQTTQLFHTAFVLEAAITVSLKNRLPQRLNLLYKNNKLFSYNVPSHRCLTKRTPL